MNSDYNGKKSSDIRNDLNILLKILGGENDVTLTDQYGVVIDVSDSYEKHYDVTKDQVIGKTVYELENEHIFYPSVTGIVLKNKCKTTIVQKNRVGHMILTTGVPIFDDFGQLQYVVSFNSIDIAGLSTMQDKYEKLKEFMAQYYSEHLIYYPNAGGIIAESQSMKNIIDTISNIADTDANVLITGETGVGKSMIAKCIHNSSKRAKKPFIEINCGTIPASLIESELFGYVPGAFTGASAKGKIGKIESANEGTLFLDEIAELSINMQIELLHVIQNKVITKVGSVKNIEIDFRLIVATNCDLHKAIANGSFRKDLFYRLNVIPIDIPPIRERREDIYPLISHFLVYYNDKYKKNIVLSKEVELFLINQDWPGNIRQIENAIERLIILSENGLIGISELKKILNKKDISSDIKRMYEKNENESLKASLENYEKILIEDAYSKCKSSVQVGKMLGISQSTAARKLRKYIPGYSESY